MTLRYSIKPLAVSMMISSVLFIVAFGWSPPNLLVLSLICALAGFTTNAGVVGLYATFAHAFPSHVRAFGTGFAIGIGRGGAVMAPVIAGFLFATGLELSWVAPIMAAGSLVGAVALLLLKFDSSHAGRG
jgi:MFS family permease